MRVRKWFACGAMWVVLLAGATAARAQTASANLAQVYPGLAGARASSDAEQRRLAAALHISLAAPDAVTVATDKPTPNANSLPESPRPQNAATYEPITGKERLTWILTQTLGPPDLAAGVLISAVGTAENQPREDGPHWGGFAERYGMRLTGIGTLSTMEAGLGALWGEDPRYVRHPEKGLGGRMTSVIVQTFMTRRRDGHFAPAYALFIAAPGSNFLSNTWRPDSEADAYHAGIRTLEAFGGIMASNAWDEFWPSVKDRLFHHSRQ